MPRKNLYVGLGVIFTGLQIHFLTKQHKQKKHIDLLIDFIAKREEQIFQDEIDDEFEFIVESNFSDEI